MIRCPNCHHENMEGALFCEECGLNLWEDSQEDIATRELDGDSDEFSVKSGWGTATFEEKNQVIIHVRDAPEPLTISVGEELLIGRQDAASGILPDLDLTSLGALEKGVSRIHAALRRGEEVLSIVDLDSANGTFLNGQRLAAPQTLVDGDQVTVASATFTFRDPEATLREARSPRLIVDPAGGDIHVNRRPVALSPKERLLFDLLHRNAGRPCTKDDIAAAVWPEYHTAAAGYQVESLVKRLREKIESDPRHPTLLLTVPGRGYKLIVD